MTRFTVPDMTCGGCVKSITAAIRALDAAAEVKADLATHTVEIASARGATELAAAIDGAGFTVQHAA